METYSIFFSYQSDIPQNKSMFMDHYCPVKVDK